MVISTWDEIRIAYQVARLGTVSGAAEVLGVHHATVIRHIDALEARLGTKLFQRHTRGYTPTEAGQELLQVAQTADDQFLQLANRLKGQRETVSGELAVTSLTMMSPLLTPVIASFQRAHQGVTVRYLTDNRLYLLEYGEAHVAIRAGAPPDQPDNVVQPFYELRHALYAAPSYIDRRGVPKTDADLSQHDFLGGIGELSRAAFFKWLGETVPRDRIVWQVLNASILADAVRSGVGLGFLPVNLARNDPSLVEVMPPREDWVSKLWLVTHVDVHRTKKVQAFLAHVKDAARKWQADG